MWVINTVMQVSYYLLSAVLYDIHIKQIYFEAKGHVSIWQLVFFLTFFLFPLIQESAAVVIFLCFTALNSFEETFHFLKKKKKSKEPKKDKRNGLGAFIRDLLVDITVKHTKTVAFGEKPWKPACKGSLVVSVWTK